jgi:N-acetylglucosamine kinase-like BadF-type ATPase
LLLAIDGGGTKTIACLAWAGAAEPIELARGLAGPSNAQAVGWETARTNIQQAVERAFQAANLPRRIAACACLAIAGAGRPDDRQRLQQWAEHVRLAEQITVTHDALAVLAAASSDRVGIALISGTGSIAFGRNRRGETARAGGWGHLIGDEGSGWCIARQALCAVARALDDRGPPTGLTAALFQSLDAGTPPQFLQKVYQFQNDRVRLAQLTPAVEAVAADGDAVALEILETAADDLAAMVSVLTVRLPLGREDRILALSGGTLIHGSILRTNLLRQLERLAYPPSRIVLVPAPVLGALAIAHARVTHGETDATS